MDTADPGVPDPSGVTILLVEDDPGDALLVTTALEDARVPESSITWTRTLAEAVTALAARPDCVLLDLGLPDATGHGAVHKIVEAAPDVPVIVLTGRTGTASRDGLDALSAGAQDYLVKDAVSGELLERSMRYAIERKRAQRTRQELRDISMSSAEQARVERGLLPTPRLRTPVMRCLTHYRPGRDDAVLGGDFYDVIEVSPGVVRAVIGDVMGHGPDEAALGVQLRVAWRTLVLAGVPDDEMLPMLGRLLATEDHWRGRFATVCDVTVTGAEARLRVAGHPAPVLTGADGAGLLPVVVGVPLGVDPQGATVAGWPESCVAMPAGASLLLYTDGLLDAFAVDSRTSLGYDELLAAVAVRPVPSASSWLADLLAAAPRDSIDDTAAVLLTRLSG